MASPHVSDDESTPPATTRDPTQSRFAFQSFLSSLNASDTHIASLRDIVLTQQQIDIVIANVAASEGHVTEFHVSGCGIPISSLSALGTALTTLSSLTHVAIEDNAMGNAGVKALCDSMSECKSLQSWGLWKNGITSVGMASIATFLSHHPLLTLDLSVNSLGPAGAELIARVLSDDPPLQHLFLANNEIGSAGTIALSQSLTLNKHLLTLGLQWNRIDESGGEALGKALMTNNTLEKLDLRWNSLGRVGNDAILAAATHNTTLNSISLCGHATAESSNLQSALNLLCQRNITRKQPSQDTSDAINGSVPVSPSIIPTSTSTSPRHAPRAISPSLSTSTRYRDSLSHVILQQEREIARQAHHIARLEKRHTLNPVKKRVIRTQTMVSPHTHTHTHTQHHRTLSPAGMSLPPPATSSTIASAIAASTTTSTATPTSTSTSTSTSPVTSTITSPSIPASPKHAPMIPPRKKQSLPIASLGLPPAPPTTSSSAPSSTHVTPRPSTSTSTSSPSATSSPQRLQLQTHHEDTSGDVIGLSLSSIPLTARAAINMLSMPHVFTCHITNNKRVDRIIFYRSSGELGALVWTDTTTTTLPLSSITSLHHGQSQPHLFTPHTDERCCITILSSTTPLCLSTETSDDALSWLHALLYIIIASGRTVSLSTFKHPGSTFTSQQYTVHPLSKSHIPSSPSAHPLSPSPRPSSPFDMSDDEHDLMNSSLASHVNLELAQSIIVLETEVARLTTALQQSQSHKDEHIYDSRTRQMTMERDIAMIRTLSLDEVRTLCAGQKACIERMEEEMRILKAQVSQLQSDLTSSRSAAATTQATLEARLSISEQQLQVARTKLSILKTSTHMDEMSLNDKDVATLDAEVSRIALPRSRTGSSDLAARRAMFEASVSPTVATSAAAAPLPAAPLPVSPMKTRGGSVTTR